MGSKKVDLLGFGFTLTAYRHSDSLAKSIATTANYWPTALKAYLKIRTRLFPIMMFLVATLLVACAVTPPVQEMSNARQTIAAAHEVRAEVFAPQHMAEAERLMSQATAALESGDYLAAKDYAVAAQKQAIKARQQAISKQNN
jgi:hypothetical protein